ncbi:MAG: ComEC/Rec2 family competence protein, partial [Candidatus Levyibacteriota bacterium]
MKKLAIFISIVLFILLLRFYFFFSIESKKGVAGPFDKQVTLLSDPKIQGKLQAFRIGSVQIKALRSPAYHYGQTLHIVGVAEQKQITVQNRKTVTITSVSFPKVTVIENNNMLLGSAAFLRQRISDSFFASLPKNEAALLFGIVFGGSGNFDDSLYQAFRNTGVLHVVAASGMNVTMVSGFLIVFLRRFLNRQIALCFGLMGISYYALISGLQPSILRAAIMASLA